MCASRIPFILCSEAVAVDAAAEGDDDAAVAEDDTADDAAAAEALLSSDTTTAPATPAVCLSACIVWHDEVRWLCY